MGGPGSDGDGPGDRGPRTGPAASRRAARERALDLLYEAELRGVRPGDVLAGQAVAPDPFTVELVEGVDAHLEELDAVLGEVSRTWAVERMPVIDRSLLRLGVLELLHHPEVPPGVAVAEAVELAGRFSTEESGRFVNGVLGRLAREARGDAS